MFRMPVSNLSAIPTFPTVSPKYYKAAAPTNQPICSSTPGSNPNQSDSVSDDSLSLYSTTGKLYK
jgi:hypothetical protein